MRCGSSRPLALAVAYPFAVRLGGEGLRRVYFAADLFGLFVSTAALITWGRATIAARRSPNGVHAVALCLAILDGSILLAPFSPWRGALFTAPFGGVQLIITLFFATFSVAQVIAWRFSPG